MELLIDKKKCEYMKVVASGNTSHEASAEIIVSDRSPDIARIVRGLGNVFITDKEARDGKVCVTGNVRGAVLYLAEDEKCIRKLDVSIPIFHAFEADGVTPDSKLKIRAHIRSFDVREVNPRKVYIRANIDISYRAFEREERILCCDVKNGNEYGVCTRHRDVYSYSPIIMREKNFSVSDDIELSGEATEMSNILIGEVALVTNETKIIGNKSIVKGVADVSYVYETESGAINSDEREIPFSQIIDIDGMDENHDLEVEVSVTGVDFDPQYDAAGKARYMTVSATAEAVATVYESSEERVVDDVYSTMCETDVKQYTLTSSKCVNKEQKRVPITECVQAGGGVKKVLDTSVSAFPPTRRREEDREILSSDVQISVMYIGEDDLVYNATRRVPVICPTELSENHTYEVVSNVRGKGYSIGAGNEINVRFFVDFDVTETEVMAVLAIAEISADTDKLRHGDKCPSVTVKRAERECDIWSLAKEHATSVQEICIANNISETERIPQGRMILIPRHS